MEGLKRSSPRVRSPPQATNSGSISRAPWFFRAQIRRNDGDLAGAASDLTRALEVVPPGSRQKADIEALYRQVRAEMGTM